MTTSFLFYYSPSWVVQGLEHPFLTPAHAIIIVALAFLIAQHGALLKSLLLFNVATICGMLINYYISSDYNLEPLLLSLALIIGLLVALRLKPVPKTLFVVLILSFLVGLMVGLDSSPIRIPGLGATAIFNWHMGAFVSFLISSLLLSLIALGLNKIWQGIVLRVLGSWVATSAVITLALQISKM